MSKEAAFYNNFGISKYFFRQISILSISFYMINILSPQMGKATDGPKEFFFMY